MGLLTPHHKKCFGFICTLSIKKKRMIASAGEKNMVMRIGLLAVFVRHHITPSYTQIHTNISVYPISIKCCKKIFLYNYYIAKQIWTDTRELLRVNKTKVQHGCAVHAEKFPCGCAHDCIVPMWTLLWNTPDIFTREVLLGVECESQSLVLYVHSTPEAKSITIQIFPLYPRCIFQ